MKKVGLSSNWLKFAPVVSGSISTALGLLVLYGWHFNRITLIQIMPNFFSMAYNTAFCFLLCGLGLLFYAFGRQFPVLIAGLIVAVIGLLKLNEYIFGAWLDVDRLLMKNNNDAFMALATAFCFLLSGSALLLMSARTLSKHSPFIIGIVGSIVLSVGAVTFFGYIIGIATKYSWWYFMGVAIHTGIGFIALSIAFLSLAWQKDGRPIKIGAPNWLTVSSGIGAVIVTIYLWEALLTQEQITMVRTSLPMAVLSMGLIVTLLLVTAIHFALKAGYRVREIEAVQDRLAGILNIAEDAVISMDESQRIRLFNKGAERIFGYSTQEILGQPLDLLLPDRYVADHHRHIIDFLHSSKVTLRMDARSEIFGKHKDGTQFPAEASISKLELTSGEKVLTVMLRDITRRKQIEEALRTAHDELEKRVEERTAELSAANSALERQVEELRRAEEQIGEQAALLNMTKDAILVRDLEDHILFWNKGAERLYGWTAEEVIGKKSSELLSKGVSSQFEKARENVLKNGEWEGELHKVTKDGREIIIESHWTLMRNGGVSPKGTIDINTDITEKKMIASQFLRVQRMESIGTLAGGIAHDLNNTLSPILMAAQLLEEMHDDEESRQLLNVILNGVERGSSMVRQVLSFARGIEGERVNFQLKHLIMDIKKMMDQTFPKSIRTELSITRGLWPVHGDATQLYQVLMNLCINARDSMRGNGKITIKAENLTLDEEYTRTHIEAKPGQFVRITVADTGEGIAPEIKDRIFEPFFTTKEIGKGTGLGLSTTLGIVKSHGGFIEVSSEVGNGAQFKIYIPTVEIEEHQQIERISTRMPIGNGESIMVVDDETSIREITRMTLEANGYRVLSAGDGTEALALFVKSMGGSIKAVLIDRMMPLLDGPATIRALKRLDPDLKIISTSGFVDEQQIDEDIAGVDRFLAKPYTAEQLLKTIAQVIGVN
jgi:two-component system, cell cycle sensor histidine kinase and response regulator CckA